MAFGLSFPDDCSIRFFRSSFSIFYLTRISSMAWWSSTSFQSTRNASRLAATIAQPGGWSMCEHISRRCRQQDSLLQPFLGPRQLKSVYSKKWTELKALIFSHLRTLPQSIKPLALRRFLICSFHLTSLYFSHYPKSIITGEDGNKYRYKNWQFCDVWNLSLCHHKATRLMENNVFALPISLSIPLFCMLFFSWI